MRYSENKEEVKPGFHATGFERSEASIHKYLIIFFSEPRKVTQNLNQALRPVHNSFILLDFIGCLLWDQTLYQGIYKNNNNNNMDVELALKRFKFEWRDKYNHYNIAQNHLRGLRRL